MTRRRIFLLAGSLALTGSSLPAQAPAGTTRQSWSAEPTHLTITPRRPALGSFVLLTFRRATGLEDSLVAVSGWMAGEPLHFVLDDSTTWHSLGAVPLEASDSVIARVVFTYASGAADTLHQTVLVAHHASPPPGGRPARARRLRVSKVFTSRPDSLVQARIERENAEARELGRRAHDTPQLWRLPFAKPRASRITSSFGSGRLFNGRVGSSHGGVDFAGRPGEAVRAANRGVIALVGSFFLAGNVVYIDHGAGVLTGYFHLTEATVAKGDTVERGQQIGLVGATGRVTGPHLHWSARYGAQTVDPMGLIQLTAPSRTRVKRAKATGRSLTGRPR